MSNPIFQRLLNEQAAYDFHFNPEHIVYLPEEVQEDYTPRSIAAGLFIGTVIGTWAYLSRRYDWTLDLDFFTWLHNDDDHHLFN